MLKNKSLSSDILKIIQDKKTEAPFSGCYTDLDEKGTYLCRQCGLALFRSDSKFHSSCGWPSFDDQLSKNIIEKPDRDGHRIEIICARCHGHLGHIFTGEGFTQKNTRYCVNSLSLDFVPNLTVKDTEEAIYAAGCFWGVEYFFKKLPGVLKTEVGYSGGLIENPTYEKVCQGNTGHFEAIRVVYDPNIITYENLTKYFFEIHNPFQKNGQGPDIGKQYLSAIFYYNDEQKNIAQSLVKILEQQGEPIATKLLPVSIFWKAEKYHQNYYEKLKKKPYCHIYEKRFF